MLPSWVKVTSTSSGRNKLRIAAIIRCTSLLCSGCACLVSDVRLLRIQYHFMKCSGRVGFLTDSDISILHNIAHIRPNDYQFVEPFSKSFTHDIKMEIFPIFYLAVIKPFATFALPKIRLFCANRVTDVCRMRD